MLMVKCLSGRPFSRWPPFFYRFVFLRFQSSLTHMVNRKPELIDSDDKLSWIASLKLADYFGLFVPFLCIHVIFCIHKKYGVLRWIKTMYFIFDHWWRHQWGITGYFFTFVYQNASTAFLFVQMLSGERITCRLSWASCSILKP